MDSTNQNMITDDEIDVIPDETVEVSEETSVDEVPTDTEEEVSVDDNNGPIDVPFDVPLNSEENLYNTEIPTDEEPVAEEPSVEESTEDPCGAETQMYEDSIDEGVPTRKKLKRIRLKTVTPFVINSRPKDNIIVATITFLCLAEDDSLLTLNRNVIVSKENDDILKLLDFHVESMYPNAIICNMLVTNHLDSYITEFDFVVDEIESNEVKLSAVNIKTNVAVELVFNPEVYAALNFIDNYVFKENIDNDYDLRLAVAIGSKENESSEFFAIDSIDSIVSMVSTDKAPTSFIGKIKNVFVKEEPSTSIGVVFKATRFLSRDKKETVSILTPFDIGVSFSPEKFKGMTVEELQKKYYGDADQYVASLIADNSRLHGIDKEYMMIRGKTKDGVTRIFLLDASIKEELKHKIEAY